MIGFIDAFIYNLSESQPIKITHSESTAEDSLNSLTTFELPERSHVSSLYNCGKDQIEITTSNSLSIILCLLVAAETYLTTC
jgi:hypothetical protein